MDSLTVPDATKPELLQMRQLLKAQGREFTVTVLSMYLAEADQMCSGKNEQSTIRLWAVHLMRKMEHRSVASILMAIRDGLNAKVYHTLTYPQIAEWMDDHEKKVIAMVESEHAATVYKNDNGGSDALDRVEFDATRDKRRADRLGRQVQELKKQLSTNQTTNQ